MKNSTREKNPVSRFGYNDYMAYHYAFMMKVVTVCQPETLSEAAKDPRWIEAINEEMQALCKNETWDFVLTSPHKKAIGCRWIQKVKYNANYMAYHYAFMMKVATIREPGNFSVMDRSHLHQILRSQQALAIHDKPRVDDP